MTTQDHELKKAIFNFYRDEIDHRYQVKNVRRFEQFEVLRDDEIDALREYFLQNIYPPQEKRQALDDAFDNLNVMLKSPKRIKPLIKTALTSVFKLGTQIPNAIAAGRATVDAYLKTRLMEAELFDRAHELGVTAKDKDNRQKMVILVAAVPEAQVKRLIYDILSLFRALSNVKLLILTVDIMEKSLKIMQKNPDIYAASEIEGLKLGLAVVQGGLDLFKGMEEEHFSHLIDGIEQVELDWFQQVLSEAKDAA